MPWLDVTDTGRRHTQANEEIPRVWIGYTNVVVPAAAYDAIGRPDRIYYRVDLDRRLWAIVPVDVNTPPGVRQYVASPWSETAGVSITATAILTQMGIKE